MQRAWDGKKKKKPPLRENRKGPDREGELPGVTVFVFHTSNAWFSKHSPLPWLAKQTEPEVPYPKGVLQPNVSPNGPFTYPALGTLGASLRTSQKKCISHHLPEQTLEFSVAAGVCICTSSFDKISLARFSTTFSLSWLSEDKIWLSTNSPDGAGFPPSSNPSVFMLSWEEGTSVCPLELVTLLFFSGVGSTFSSSIGSTIGGVSIWTQLLLGLYLVKGYWNPAGSLNWTF